MRESKHQRAVWEVLRRTGDTCGDLPSPGPLPENCPPRDPEAELDKLSPGKLESGGWLSGCRAEIRSELWDWGWHSGATESRPHANDKGKPVCADRGAKGRHWNTAGEEGRGPAGLVSGFSSSFRKPVPRQMLVPVIGVYAICLCLSINSSFIIILKLKLDWVGFRFLATQRHEGKIIFKSTIRVRKVELWVCISPSIFFTAIISLSFFFLGIEEICRSPLLFPLPAAV